jgi:hypothetical protein
MLSALIPSAGRKPAVPLAGQLAHESCVRPGPLVLGTAFLKSPTAATDRDRTVSRRSKPSSRTALMGEQPNPWDRLQPQDATSRHRTFSAVSGGADYISTLPDQLGEGSACCSGHRFRPRGRVVATGHYASVVTGSNRELYLDSGKTCGNTNSVNRAVPPTDKRMR